MNTGCWHGAGEYACQPPDYRQPFHASDDAAGSSDGGAVADAEPVVGAATATITLDADIAAIGAAGCG